MRQDLRLGRLRTTLKLETVEALLGQIQHKACTSTFGQTVR
jgi:hypothetical protein